MKKFLTIIAAVIVSVAASDAKLPYKGKGYSGEASLGGTVGLNTDFGSRFTVLTTHGYSFGDGVFAGLGTGVMADFAGHFSVPVYGKGTYTFETGKEARPYLGASVGLVFNEDLNTSVMVAPEIGVRFGRFYLNIQYSFNDFLNTVSVGVGGGSVKEITDVYNLHMMSFGVGIAFLLILTQFYAPLRSQTGKACMAAEVLSLSIKNHLFFRWNDFRRICIYICGFWKKWSPNILFYAH